MIVLDDDEVECWLVCFTSPNVITGRNEVVAKVIFLHLFVILFTGEEWYPRRHWGRPPRQQIPPQRRHTPPGADTPSDQTPPDQTHPPPEADSGIRSTGGRYASYWNAFLFKLSYWSTSLVAFCFCLPLAKYYLYVIIHFNNHCFSSKISTCPLGKVNWKPTCPEVKFTRHRRVDKF